ncbi:MAG: class IV adenylate cyclase [Gemmatimonadota bacterium]|nr:class IV adenylate cyclase [Gemmatimonadota bacterium]
MREVEVKGVVADPAALRERLLAAGAREVYSGALSDVRFDTHEGALLAVDHVLRLRRTGAREAVVDWKGPTSQADGFKVREEISSPCGDGAAMRRIVEQLGYHPIHEIDREIEQFAWQDVTLRIERYPRMDVLLEVEGEPAAIDAVIAALELDRAAFTAERLADFVARYEARTGERAAVSVREAAGDYSLRGSLR